MTTNTLRRQGTQGAISTATQPECLVSYAGSMVSNISKHMWDTLVSLIQKYQLALDDYYGNPQGGAWAIPRNTQTPPPTNVTSGPTPPGIDRLHRTGSQ